MRLRHAERSDVPILLELIRELAEYEHLADEVVATEADLETSMFGPRPAAEAILAIDGDRAVGFALFFMNFSTFLGRSGLYLEDLFVRPSHRGRGLGRRLLGELARIARERGCGRMEWWVLDWNRPAIAFYRSLGAVPMEDWTVFRLAGADLERLAGADREDARPE